MLQSCLSLRLVGACYGISDRGLGLVLEVLSRLSHVVKMLQSCLSLRLVGACYGLSDRGLGLVLEVLSRLSHVVKKIIPTPSQVGILIQTSWDILRPVGEM